jgi:hypothetical protein
MRRVIGMDIHRTFAEVVFWEALLRWCSGKMVICVRQDASA